MTHFFLLFNPFNKCSKFLRQKRRRIGVGMPTCYLLSSKSMLTFAFILLVYFFTMDMILFHKIKQRLPLKPIQILLSSSSSSLTQTLNKTTLTANFPPPHISIQNENNPDTLSSSSYFWSPLTIKKIMIVDSTHYIRSPLAEFVESFFCFSKMFPFISANVISLIHCVLSLVSVRYLTHDSLRWRQFGVVLFQVRNWLDSFDGVIYRAHSTSMTNNHDYKSHYGSLG